MLTVISNKSLQNTVPQGFHVKLIFFFFFCFYTAFLRQCCVFLLFEAGKSGAFFSSVVVVVCSLPLFIGHESVSPGKSRHCTCAGGALPSIRCVREGGLPVQD